MSSDFPLVRSFPVGRYTVTFTVVWPGDRVGDEAPVDIKCEPAPDGVITDAEMADFFRVRRDVMREATALAAARGVQLNMIEVGTGPAVTEKALQ